MQTFKVSSSHGYLIVDSETGVVRECRSDRRTEDYLPDILRFDVGRFRTAFKTKQIPTDVDILKFVYYNKDGSYDTPADGYERGPDYSLCEAIADISYIAAKENYRTTDSRLMIAQFIEWANDFEYLHRKIVWGENSPMDYPGSIYHFTIFKITQWREE